MAWKDSREYSEGWEEKTKIQERRQKLVRKILGWVLAVAGVATICLIVAVILEKRTPAVEGGHPELGENRFEVGESEQGAASPEGSALPPEVSPHFNNPLVGSLRKIGMEGEPNLAALVFIYGNELKNPKLHPPLRAVFQAVRDKKYERALEIADDIQGAQKVRLALRGVALTRLLNRKLAGEAFSRADVKGQPAEFYFEYGVYFLSAEDSVRAYEQFAAGARRKKGSSMLNFAAAQVAFAQENWEDAIMHVDAGVDDAREIGENVVLWAASSEVNINKPASAIARCRQHLEDHPDAHRVRLFLARILGSSGRLEEAMVMYGELRNSHPNTELVVIESVRAFLLNEDAASALPLAAEWARKKPDDIRIQAWYADVLAAAGKNEEATKILEGFSDQLKANEKAALDALLAVRQKNYKKAAAALEPYHTMDPILGMRWAALKMEEHEGGNLQGGVQSILANHRLNIRQWKQVAQLAAPKHWDMASFAYGKAIASGDTSLETLNNWAWASLENPKGFEFEEVHQVCRQALALSHANPSVLHTFGRAMLKSDQPGACAQLLVEHYEVTEASAELSLLRAEAYRALRAYPSARAAYEKSLQLASAASKWPLELGRKELEEQIVNLQK